MNTDQKFIDGLGKLKTDLNDKVLRLNVIQRDIQQLSQYYNSDAYQYLEDLLHPETRVGVKLPSRVPVPSTTFQLKSTYVIWPSKAGAFMARINPFFLASDLEMNKWHQWKRTNGGTLKGYWCGYLTTGNLVAAERYDGTYSTYQKFGVSRSNVWTNFDLGQTVPDGLYNMYRLVSASLKVRYMGPVEEASGFIGGSILIDGPNDNVTGRYYFSNTDSGYNPNEKTKATLSNTYANENIIFNTIRKAPYNMEVDTLSGLKLLYFPPDNSFEEFYPLVSYANIKEDAWGERDQYGGTDGQPYFKSPAVKSGFNWYVYGAGLRPNKLDIRVELCCNFECLPAAKFTNYMPVRPSVRYINAKEKKQVLQEVMENSINKLNK